MAQDKFMTIDELRAFAKDRGVQIIAPAPTSTHVGPLISRHDLAALPKVSPLQKLPSELRNRIYEELLCFKVGRNTCFPTILATNKQINAEASGILYGGNYFHVRLGNKHGVTVQGRWCGPYREARLGRKILRNTEDCRYIKWPAFMRRVENVRFSIPGRHANIPMDRKASTENVLYSLCSFLANHHKVENLSLDLRRWSKDNGNWIVVAETADVHCLLLLDPRPTLNITGHAIHGPLASQLHVESTVDLCTVGRVSMMHCLEYYTKCRQAFYEPAGISTPDAKVLERFIDDCFEAFRYHVMPVLNSAQLSKRAAAARFANFVSDVREIMERHDIPFRGPLIHALDKLLHFDIDTKVARYAANKFMRGLKADE